MRVALEFKIVTKVRYPGAAMAILDGVGHPLRALHVDPIHVDRSDSSIVAIAAVDPSLFSYAQFCDAPAERPDPNDFEILRKWRVAKRSRRAHPLKTKAESRTGESNERRFLAVALCHRL